MILSFAGDAVVALLLIATIGYSVVLNRRLGAVRSDREKFEVLVRNLNAASQRAEAAVANLRVTADELSRRLEKKVEEARALSDDLTYMIERGGNIADRLANQIRAGRDELKPDFRPEPKVSTKPQPQAGNPHVVEPVLVRPAPAARQVREAEPPRAESQRVEPQRVEPQRVEPQRVEPQHAELQRPAFARSEARVEPIRVEPRVTVAPAATANDADPAIERAAAPSRAERDLLRALAARRR
jgi:Domain of unknown function (DUF6468)